VFEELLEAAAVDHDHLATSTFSDFTCPNESRRRSSSRFMNM
jgi:hypothetical protein